MPFSLTSASISVSGDTAGQRSGSSRVARSHECRASIRSATIIGVSMMPTLLGATVSTAMEPAVGNDEQQRLVCGNEKAGVPDGADTAQPEVEIPCRPSPTMKVPSPYRSATGVLIVAVHSGDITTRRAVSVGHPIRGFVGAASGGGGSWASCGTIRASPLLDNSSR